MTVKTGKFMPRDPADAFKLTFEGRRNFVIVKAYAENSGGLIGSEYNGVAILDADRGEVIASRIGMGNGWVQDRVMSEFRASDLDWKGFCEKVEQIAKGRVNGLVTVPSDVREGVEGGDPDYFDPVLQKIRGNDVDLPAGPDIRTPAQIAANADPEIGYSFPAATRDEMIVAICSHRFRGDNRRNYFAWNIKVGRFDETGKNHGGNTEGENDPRLDRFFDAMTSSTIFEDACEMELRQYTEDREASSYPGDDQGNWEFGREGRSGGWLVLSKWCDRSMSFETVPDLVGDLRGWSDRSLADFYNGIVVFDHDLSDPTAIVNYAVSVIRSDKESEWKENPETAVSDAFDKLGSGMDMEVLVPVATEVLGIEPVEFVRLAMQADIPVRSTVEACDLLKIDRGTILKMAEEERYRLYERDLVDHQPEVAAPSI